MSRILAVGAVLLISAVAFADKPDPSALAAKIDAHLATVWEKEKVVPTQPADDAVFLRRLYLDLIGRIPTVAETRAFLEDKEPNKRAALIDRLVDSGGHAHHFAAVWRRAWMPQADTPEFANLIDDFENWISVRIRDNVPYDRVVRELMTVPQRRRGQTAKAVDVSPEGFLAASQYKPETLAANTTRAFLGLNLDCAQCHNHPFSRWTRDQFWQTAAFFTAPITVADNAAKLEISIPDTQKVVQPLYLDDRAVSLPEQLGAETGRRLLADWVVTSDNPYFARNAVNRLWSAFFGLGLVEPLDDLSDDNPPRLPKLMEELTAAFRASNFDLQYITRAIALTKAYQAGSSLPDNSEDDPALFGRMPIRGLTGEQLYDSLLVAAGQPVERRDLLSSRDSGRRRQFAARMLISRPAAAERSIVQALSMMNGSLTSDLTSPKRSSTLAAAIDAPFLNTQEKVDTLFFAALNRRPSPNESSRLVNYVAEGGDDRAMPESLADIFWTLLNSSEFNTNH